MAASFEWVGLKELMAELRTLPDALTDDAAAIVIGAATAAKNEIAAAYPVRTGTLRDSMTVETQSGGRFGAKAAVTNTSKYAGWFERGTTTRQTALGANRGAMPPGNVFVPRVVKHRQQMYRDLGAMVEGHGDMKVPGLP